MTGFWTRFPELAPHETRVAHVLEPHEGLMPGGYAFVEMYCVDRKCDCRRVVIRVLREDSPEIILASIEFGWESVEFYANWLDGDVKEAAAIVSGTLDPLNPQTALAPALLNLFQEVAISDPKYVERLARHYAMFKENLGSGKSRRQLRRSVQAGESMGRGAPL